MATSGKDARAAREAKLDALHERLTGAVEQLVSGEDWARALAFAARFRARSFANTILIFTQHQEAHELGLVPDPVPSHVAGYRQWQQLGRQVSKGQPGYQILAPVTGRFASATPQDAESWRRLGKGEKPRAGETVRTKMVDVRPAYVWDASQTTGEPIPEPPAPRLLEGQAPVGLWEGLADQVAKAGFELRLVADASEMFGAFWLSFTALADLAARSGIGTGQAWAWPLIVDGIIVVATVAIVALAGQKAAWYPWALLIGDAVVSVTANALTWAQDSNKARTETIDDGKGSSLVRGVELRGFEPLTFSLRRRMPGRPERVHAIQPVNWMPCCAQNPLAGSTGGPRILACLRHGIRRWVPLREGASAARPRSSTRRRGLVICRITCRRSRGTASEMRSRWLRASQGWGQSSRVRLRVPGMCSLWGRGSCRSGIGMPWGQALRPVEVCGAP